MRRTALTVLLVLFFTVRIYAVDFNTCFNYAGRVFNISPLLLKSIAEVESNFNQSAIHKNPNGTIDVGIMQINSCWIRTIGWKHWAMVRKDACYNIYVGAWILRRCINRYGYTWLAVSCYHTGNGYSFSYARKVYMAYVRNWYGTKASD